MKCRDNTLDRSEKEMSVDVSLKEEVKSDEPSLIVPKIKNSKIENTDAKKQ